jgi:Subtilase family/Proprotein convertase P-domain/Peptidase inhibitor I9
MTRSDPSVRSRPLALAGLMAAIVLIVAAQVTPATASGGNIRHERSAKAIPGEYVVVLDDAELNKRQPDTVISFLARGHQATVRYRYLNAFRGFAAEMSRAQALRLSKNPAVSYVQQNQAVALADVQSDPPWGLNRIDQRDLPLNSSFRYDVTASNVRAYIIDSGIRTTHADFGGRAVWGINTTGDGKDTDCNGHGTHVAGTVAGAKHGVAKNVTLVAVKVLNCAGSGSFAGVAAGIDWVTAQHQPGNPAVANISLGSAGSDSAIETAVRNSIADGVVYAVASGNSGSNACNFTPARVAEAITVNATTTADARAPYSNFGTCTDLFAPGQNIRSAWNSSDTASNAVSGTSMAAPHVAGAAALLLSVTPTATPATIADQLVNNASANKVSNAGAGSPNRLLYAGVANPPPPPPNQCSQRTNGTDVAIPDLGTASSPISVSSCAGNASAVTTVDVHIVHTYRADLVIDLVAPNGTIRNVLNRTGGSSDDVDQTFTLDLSTVPANGTWSLRVRDTASFDTGFIDSWTIDP